MTRRAAVLERVAIAVASLLLSVGLIALLSGFFAGQDQAGVSAKKVVSTLGQRFADLGHRHLSRPAHHPHYDSDPPTSGAHVAVTAGPRDGVPLSDDALLESLELGNVVLMYGTPKPPPALVALQHVVSGPYNQQSAGYGQSVVLARRRGTTGAIGVAWTRLLRVADPADPRLRQFTEQWIGRGAPQR